jgi:hypothetical protein
MSKQDRIQRTVLPIPDMKYLPIQELRPPTGEPISSLLVIRKVWEQMMNLN